MTLPRFCSAALLFILAATLTVHADPSSPGTPPTPPAGPFSPKDELATFKIIPGFSVSLVASEPNVIDPVAMGFDPRGRIFVCEMRGYPNGGVGTGNESRGRIRLLTDRDGDGVYETSHVYAEGLRFPMGVMPWKNGIIVAVAPDIVYLEDTNGDETADKSTVLYTGFNLANIQQMVNSLQWGQDNWVYGIGGSNAGTIRSPQKPDMPPVALGSRGFRFRPDRPGSFEPTSGGGQYGLSADPFGHWFTATNSQHIRQIVIPDSYLRRNPSAPVTSTTADISDHGASAKVFRISPFEGWRVERTTRRVNSELAKRLASTELVPGGFTSSSCGGVIYTADQFPRDFQGNFFVCDPGNNMIHRDVLEATGGAFTAKRGDADCEFLASTDNWFRPVSLTQGPDGALYLLDFYREVIETPLSLPDDIKAKLNLESRERGRIWRIAPTGFSASRLRDLSKLSPNQLAELVAHPNATVRLQAQQQLVERDAKSCVPMLTKLANSHRNSQALPNLLFMLREFGDLPDSLILAAMKDTLPGNREVGLRLAESRFVSSPELCAQAEKLANDPAPMVRFQAALSASELPADAAKRTLNAIIRRDARDVWTQSAVLISAKNGLADLLTGVLITPSNEAPPALRQFVLKSATSIGTRGKPEELSHVLEALKGTVPSRNMEFAVIEGIGIGTRGKLSQPDSLQLSKKAAQAVANAFTVAVSEASAAKSPSELLQAIRVLAFAPYPTAAKPLAGLLNPQSSPEVQLAAVRSLAAHGEAEVPETLLKAWPQLGPSVRREVLEQLLASPQRAEKLLTAIESGRMKAAELEPARVAQLKTHPNATIRERAAKLLANTATANRKDVLAAYRSALELNGDAEKGRAVFKSQCAACHKVGMDGHDVGPNLLAVIPGKTGDDLMTAILDPNREVDPRYMNYNASTADGKVLTGIIVAETPASITLKRADGTEDTIQRSDLESLKSTGLSLMPEGLEKSISKQDFADLLAFLKLIVSQSKK